MASRPAAGFIFLTVLLDVIGIGIIIPILPQIVTEMVGGDPSIGARYYGPIASVFALMQFLFSPLLGAISDRYGRRPILLGNMFGYALSYVVMGLATSLEVLVLGRVFAGITGATITTANAYLADISTPETRAGNFGLIGAAFGVGFIVGPAVGGLLGQLGPRVPFFVAAVLVLFNFAYGVFVLPESLPPEHRRPLNLRDANPLTSLLALRRYPVVARLALAFVFMTLARRGLESVWVLYTDYRFGWKELENGLALTLVGVMAAFVQGYLIRKVVPLFGERRTIVVGLAISCVSYVLYGLASVPLVMLLVIPIGSLGGIAQPALMGVVTGQVDRSEQGAVQGALTSVMSLTAIAAPLIATGLLAAFTRPGAPLVPGAPFFASALFGAVALVLTARALPQAQSQ